MLLRIFTLLLPFLIITQPVLADQKAPFKISYRITSLVPIQGKSYTNKIGGDSVAIAKLHVSKPINAELREGGFLDFFEDTAKPETPPAFSVKFPQSSNSGDLLIIMLSNKGKVKYLLHDLNALRIPGGGQYVHNLLVSPIAVQCGKDQKPVVIPGKQQKVIAAPKKDKVIQSVFYKTEKQAYQKFSSNLYFKDKKSRYIVFCHQENGKKSPSLTQIAVYDQPPVEDKP
ncbi:hypothetical protein NT6N_15160 [Oceaniferula spumae]|uniref:Uncharacterized protein n=1 Tax=Oceaniferula spumae TaxID=2979115 RepID=A0AAT9FKE5_9BACT